MPERPSLDELFRDGKAIDAAMREAAWEALRVHKQAGLPLAIWRDGQVCWVSAEELEAEWLAAEQGASGPLPSPSPAAAGEGAGG